MSDWSFLLHSVLSQKWICQTGPVLIWWLPLNYPVDLALWQVPVTPQYIRVIPNYHSLRSEPINKLHWNQICILIRELPWRILIRGDTFRASSTLLLCIPFETWLGNVSTIQIEARWGIIRTACCSSRRQEQKSLNYIPCYCLKENSRKPPNIFLYHSFNLEMKDVRKFVPLSPQR